MNRWVISCVRCADCSMVEPAALKRSNCRRRHWPTYVNRRSNFRRQRRQCPNRSRLGHHRGEPLTQYADADVFIVRSSIKQDRLWSNPSTTPATVLSSVPFTKQSSFSQVGPGRRHRVWHPSETLGRTKLITSLDSGVISGTNLYHRDCVIRSEAIGRYFSSNSSRRLCSIKEVIPSENLPWLRKRELDGGVIRLTKRQIP
jgi:hypothetical protein